MKWKVLFLSGNLANFEILIFPECTCSGVYEINFFVHGIWVKLSLSMLCLGHMGSWAHGLSGSWGSVAHGAHLANWAHGLSGTWAPRHLSPQALGHTCTWALGFSESRAIGLSGQWALRISGLNGFLGSWAFGLIGLMGSLGHGLSGSWAHVLICLTTAASNFGSVKLGLVKLLYRFA
jgi:hypothetical protein